MDLKATIRETFGKANKGLREQGLIPGEFYGHGMKNETLSVDRGEFNKVFKEAGENTVITLLMGDKKQPSIIYDVQHDPRTGDVIHVDFYGVRMDEKIKAKVPLEFIGEAPAVKEKGGVVNRALSEIEVESLPGDLPHSLQIDLSGLAEINQSIYIKDIDIRKNFKILLSADTVIVTIMPPVKEEEIAPAPAPDVSEVKVETEEKKAARAEEKEKEATPNA